MVNAARLAGRFLAALPPDQSPERDYRAARPASFTRWNAHSLGRACQGAADPARLRTRRAERPSGRCWKKSPADLRAAEPRARLDAHLHRAIPEHALLQARARTCAQWSSPGRPSAAPGWRRKSSAIRGGTDGSNLTQRGLADRRTSSAECTEVHSQAGVGQPAGHGEAKAVETPSSILPQCGTNTPHESSPPALFACLPLVSCSLVAPPSTATCGTRPWQPDGRAGEFFVVSNTNDNHAIDHRIAEALQAGGRTADLGPVLPR